MNSLDIKITPELAVHFDDVENLAAAAFGPGRFARTAFRLREGVAHESELSFVALSGDKVVGSVRVTRIIIGMRAALMLGPLVVEPDCANEGIGKHLMQTCVNACRDMGYEMIILVGDEPYYRPFGFKQIPAGRITLPGPVEPARLLYCELGEGMAAKFNGMARPYSTLNSIF